MKRYISTFKHWSVKIKKGYGAQIKERNIQRKLSWETTKETYLDGSE
jgi:hypothetical protein